MMHADKIEWIFLLSIVCSMMYNLPMVIENVYKVYMQRFGDYNLNYWVDLVLSLLIISPLLILGFLNDIMLGMLTSTMLNTYESLEL